MEMHYLKRSFSPTEALDLWVPWEWFLHHNISKVKNVECVHLCLTVSFNSPYLLLVLWGFIYLD